MRVLITSEWYKPAINGVVTSVLNLKEGLEKEGHEVRILTLSTTSTSYFEDDVYYIGSLNIGRIYPGARFKSKSARREIRNIMMWKPDIIHTQTEFTTYVVAKKIAKVCRVPIVHTYHTVYEDYTHYFSPSKEMGKRAVMLMTRFVAKGSKCIITPTKKVKTMLERYNVSCPVDVIPSGVNLNKYSASIDDAEIQSLKKSLNIKDNHTVLLSLGRLCKEKNITEIINFMNNLEDKDTLLLIVGDGPTKNSLVKLVSSLGLSDRILFTGMVSPDSVPLYYSIADLFVSASQSETQGLTYVEALSSGTPLLCRKDSCLDDILNENENGYSYETQEEFYAKLCTFKSNPDKSAMKAAAKKAVFDYSIESFGKNVSNVYLRYVKQSSKSKKELERVNVVA